MSDGLKKSIQEGIKDASADVRKAARHLFWVLKSIPSYEQKMDRLLESFDASTKKHIKQEIQTASEDFIELLNNPTGGLDDTSVTSAVCAHVTPFEKKQTTEKPEHSLGSSLGRPLSDRSVMSGKSSQPPPLPAQTQTQSQGVSRQSSGPSRVMHGASSSATSASSSVPEGPIRRATSTHHERTIDSVNEIDDMRSSGSSAGTAGMTESRDKTRGGLGGARRTMAAERVIRPTPDANPHPSHNRPMWQSGDTISPGESELPPTGPTAPPISNSIRNKR
jgi:hypothetical protein